jgi:hypothetical protein
MAGICARSRRSLGGGQATTDRMVRYWLGEMLKFFSPFQRLPHHPTRPPKSSRLLREMTRIGRPIVLTLRHVDMTRPASAHSLTLVLHLRHVIVELA